MHWRAAPKRRQKWKDRVKAGQRRRRFILIWLFARKVLSKCLRMELFKPKLQAVVLLAYCVRRKIWGLSEQLGIKRGIWVRVSHNAGSPHVCV